MELALDTGLVAAILPDLLPMKGMFQGKPMQPEGDLWDHAMLVLELLPANPSFTLAFAALLHDVGKPRTRQFHQGRYQLSPPRAGRCTISDRLCRDLKLSNAERERINWLVDFSSVPGRGQETPRVEAQADPGGARDRRTPGASSRRRAGVDGQHRARRLLPILLEI